ncbi:MAG: YeeE/YedE family protein [bacterium]|nr:YeeE/YedE family protein [Gammaproteobacteria bacterium]HIL97818.1 YeeE/YedE family protein [Pseudomonadales bacterium]
MPADFINATLGGLMIGTSAALMLWLLGRITGISGIFWNAISDSLNHQFSGTAWRWFFIAGLVAGTLLAHQIFAFPVPAPRDAGPVLTILGGLLVGFGTRFGSGCTSGHGICGIGRLSSRSLAATCCFMASGIATTFVVRHLI